MGNFIDKTLDEFNKVLKSFLLFEEKKESFLCSINERIKIVILLFILIIISLLQRIELIIAFYLLSIIIGYLGKIGVRNLLRTTWIFIPIFTLIIALPTAFINPLNFSFGFTREGLLNALRFVLRVATSISYIRLLILSTSWIKILSGLRGIGIPSLIITIIAITYRYIFLLLKIGEDLYFAKKSRTIKINLKREHSFTANSIGIMAIKSHELSKEVYQGMLSRGITKDFSFSFESKISMRDIVILISVIFIILILFLIFEGIKI
ncbi:MAG: cobalt ECF transporter T component CbiQ [Dictyoglomus sp.]|nr:cobalt ECF transporter T component CbiQ [Dictyoglomus sp.]MCX7942324.1 cobalt ECF transporter T component CbiQ [Dictyoglomaceae bacterium]MDW8188873.1 cobalt ECF transporter T component CbiQ [Dictyoglomus sp.]